MGKHRSRVAKSNRTEGTMPGARRGYATEKPVCGRKHCNTCGRWRHVLDFTPSRRRHDGVVTTFRPSCRVCTMRRWQEKNKHSQETMERKREYNRIYHEAKRREAGVRPRNFSKPRATAESSYERIPNAPIREAFLASAMTGVELARLAGYERKAHGGTGNAITKPDDGWVLRLLGLRTDNRNVAPQVTMSYHHAVRLVKAMDLLPADYGV